MRSNAVHPRVDRAAQQEIEQTSRDREWSAMPASEAAHQALQETARKLAATHESLGSARQIQFREDVAAAAEIVRERLSDPESNRRGSPLNSAAASLLPVFRQAILAEAAGGLVAPAAAFALLLAIERAQAEEATDASECFVNRLAGPDGFRLLVEVTHDMRSPLNAILFLIEQIRSGRSGSLSAIQERQAGLVYSAAFGLSALASDVIELAHDGHRLMDREPTPFSLASVLQSVRDIVLPVAEEKRLTLRISPAEADVRLGHPTALCRVLLNLTTNALKFTPAGYVEVSCRSTSRQRVEFSVSDTGRGIPNDVLARLFQAFRRRPGDGSYAFSSAGLGLSICQRLISAMGGELKVETELEKGTQFSFELDLPLGPRVSGPSW